MISTKQETRCAESDCPRTSRDAIAHETPWHKVHGWTAHEGRDVIGSWADACPEHATAAAAAIQADVEDHPGPWSVTVRRTHYGSHQADEVTQHSNGDGTPGTLF